MAFKIVHTHQITVKLKGNESVSLHINHVIYRALSITPVSFHLTRQNEKWMLAVILLALFVIIIVTEKQQKLWQVKTNSVSRKYAILDKVLSHVGWSDETCRLGRKKAAGIIHSVDSNNAST